MKKMKRKKKTKLNIKYNAKIFSKEESFSKYGE